MKKEFIKESGKFLLDLSKIMFAIAFISPLVQNNKISIIFATIVIIVASVGIFLIYKGTNNDQ
jgi:hypothetical protein